MYIYTPSFVINYFWKRSKLYLLNYQELYSTQPWATTVCHILVAMLDTQ